MVYMELMFKLIENMPQKLRSSVFEYLDNEYRTANEKIREIELNYHPLTGVPKDVANSAEFKQLVDYKDFTYLLSNACLMYRKLQKQKPSI